MSADERDAVRQRAVDGADDRILRAARVGEDGSRPADFRGLPDLSDDAIDGGTKEDEVRVPGGAGEVARAGVDRAATDGPGQRLWRAANAENPARHAPLARRQPDGPADQTNADDRERIDPHCGVDYSGRGEAPGMTNVE